ERDMCGNPRPPYQLNHVIYLLNPVTAQKFTVINSTVGLSIAYRELVDAVRTMRKLRGVVVVPVVRLGSAPMKTKYGVKSRPHFPIMRWVTFGAAGITADTPKMIGAPIAEPTSAEIINDAIPF